MAKSDKAQGSSAVETMLRDLRAAESFSANLTASAPNAVLAAGGVRSIMAKFAGRPNGCGFWSIDMTSPEGVELWSQMAMEQQALARGHD